MKLRRNRRLCTGEDCRSDVDVPCRAVVLATAAARIDDDQGNLQRRLVREQSVRELSMIAERFAVITGDDDERVRVIAQNRRQEVAELLIDVCDFAKVWRVAIRVAERRR